MTDRKKHLLLNCDMGESFGPWQMGCDAEVMVFVDMANIACGFHASEPDTMAQTVKLAVEYGVTVGAHPGYDDKAGFGRRSIPHSPESITHLMQYQVGALQAICQLYGSEVSYIKPHGALYHDMMNKQEVFEAILDAAASFNGQVRLMIQATANNQNYLSLAKAKNVELLFEAFADRAYNDKGQLLPRSQSGAVHHDSDIICKQARLIATEGVVITDTGNRLPLNADTLCVHGDNPESIAVVQRIREALA
ncbi:hypothetical protein EOPP23_14670 [Endozoicomonas sp. OPT23]|uniref:5-oxoprolinase subunit PxpA n=1 Tax=Endozoicomonas sp. OPT23 TaxID=2072845 RepID=UPI00129B6CD7|nr:5-oxoprolinase subunit PxpA [Endozoicomonas sp. OPT23]MRI34235.1 hypothetical protein [Endozoicomonas sp. OPT23]